MKYSFSQLEDLWKQAGGNPVYAAMAAAIAMAESGGNSDSKNGNSNGTTDRGLWQINSIHGGLSTFDPNANAKAAVSISKNGTTWRPWCTAWSNGKCGGTFLGSGSPVLKYLPTNSTPSDVTPAPDSTAQLSLGSSGKDVITSAVGGGIAEAIDNGISRIGIGVFYGAMIVLGYGLMMVGFWLIVLNSGVGRTAMSLVGGTSKRVGRQVIGRVGGSKRNSAVKTTVKAVKKEGSE